MPHAAAHAIAQPVPNDQHTQPLDESSTTTDEVRHALRTRQRELVESYVAEPGLASITDGARTGAVNDDDGPLDPMYTRVEVGTGHDMHLPVALHTAVGGKSDLPVPGDILCAALASCADSTIRVVANGLGVRLQELRVEVRGHVDVRGTLCVSPDVPVAFQRMTIHITLRAAEGTDPRRVRQLVKSAEHCCVVLKTLREGVPIDIEPLDITSDA